MTAPRAIRTALPLFALGCAAVGCQSTVGADDVARAGTVAGVVYHDRDGDGVRDRFEFGIRGVAVSNGRDVVRTDRRGRYRLPLPGAATVFVVKPKGFATPSDEIGLPRFYYHHRPDGSPPDLLHRGLEATGPPPASVDFPLTRQRESSRFEVLLFGDPQPYTSEQLDHFAADIIPELIGSDAAFGITLGDIVGDDLSLFSPLASVVGQIGIPWYNVPGNHDINFDATSDSDSLETFTRVFGPSSYAFQYASAHFIVLDDVVYGGSLPDGGSVRNYVGGLRDDQLAFLRGYLSGVPRDDLVVLAMHIPLAGPAPTLEVPERRELFAILSDHPHNLSIAGHTHTQEQHFFGPAQGYAGPEPHHHLVQGTTSGSWWLGAADETGIPHAMMRDGTPNGYSFLRVDGNAYTVRYKVARRPASYQMNIHAPPALSASEAQGREFFVNVFAGSERTTVEMRVGGGDDWAGLERVAAPAPFFVAVKQREASLRTPLPPADDSTHLWRGVLPTGLPVGAHVLEIRATDMFGDTSRATHVLRVE